MIALTAIHHISIISYNYNRSRRFIATFSDLTR